MDCRNYADITAKLEDLQRTADEDGKRAISEAIDIIYDYTRQAKVYEEMVNKYLKAARPVAAYSNPELMLCPDCHKRVNSYHSHCHRCGQRLDWSQTMRARKQETEEYGKTKRTR